MQPLSHPATGSPARPGKLALYAHNGGRIGVMAEVSTVTEAASRTPAFASFVHEITLQIAAAAPSYVSDEEIPPETLVHMAQEASDRARRAGKPERIVAKIVAGVLEKYKNEHVLMRQPYIRDESICIAHCLAQICDELGENIVVRRFLRWEIGPQSEQGEAPQ